MGIAKKLLILAVLGIVAAIYLLHEPYFDLSVIRGKRVLVTGASSGIGEQLAYQYAQNGASVFITARRKNLLEKVVQKCKELGSPDATFGYISADMSNMSQTTSVIEGAVKLLGGLDQVVLNHALIPTPRLFENSPDHFNELQKVIDVNMRSFAHLAIEALPYLQETNGSLTAVSSIAGKLGFPLFSTYCTSKFALDGFFSVFRQDIKKHNVSVTVAVLGAIGTEKLDEIISNMNISKVEELQWTPGSPTECAFEIMRGTTLREREVYFPSSQGIKYMVMFRDIVTHFVDTNPV